MDIVALCYKGHRSRGRRALYSILYYYPFSITCVPEHFELQTFCSVWVTLSQYNEAGLEERVTSSQFHHNRVPFFPATFQLFLLFLCKTWIRCRTLHSVFTSLTLSMHIFGIWENQSTLILRSHVENLRWDTLCSITTKLVYWPT